MEKPVVEEKRRNKCAICHKLCRGDRENQKEVDLLREDQHGTFRPTYVRNKMLRRENSMLSFLL